MAGSGDDRISAIRPGLPRGLSALPPVCTAQISPTRHHGHVAASGQRSNGDRRDGTPRPCRADTGRPNTASRDQPEPAAAAGTREHIHTDREEAAVSRTAAFRSRSPQPRLPILGGATSREQPSRSATQVAPSQRLRRMVVDRKNRCVPVRPVQRLPAPRSGLVPACDRDNFRDSPGVGGVPVNRWLCYP